MRSRRSIWTLATEALVSSGPLWHSVHLALPTNRLIPFSACGLRLPAPSKNWSTELWSETRVDSYSWSARPQNREKLASIWVNWTPSSVTLSVPAQKAGWKAFLIKSWYETDRPVACGLLRELARPASTLSVGSTI